MNILFCANILQLFIPIGAKSWLPALPLLIAKRRKKRTLGVNVAKGIRIRWRLHAVLWRRGSACGTFDSNCVTSSEQLRSGGDKKSLGTFLKITRRNSVCAISVFSSAGNVEREMKCEFHQTVNKKYEKKKNVYYATMFNSIASRALRNVHA